MWLKEDQKGNEMKGMRGREYDHQKNTLKGKRDSVYRPIDFYFKL